MTTTTKPSKKSNPSKNVMSDTSPQDEPLNFELALQELEQITQQMQQGQLGLQDMMNAYKRGMALSAQCQTLLDHAQQEIFVLEQTAQGDVLKPFNTSNQ